MPSSGNCAVRFLPTGDIMLLDYFFFNITLYRQKNSVLLVQESISQHKSEEESNKMAQVAALGSDS